MDARCQRNRDDSEIFTWNICVLRVRVRVRDKWILRFITYDIPREVGQNWKSAFEYPEQKSNFISVRVSEVLNNVFINMSFRTVSNRALQLCRHVTALLKPKSPWQNPFSYWPDYLAIMYLPDTLIVDSITRKQFIEMNIALKIFQYSMENRAMPIDDVLI